ncbi:transcription factor CP2-like protein 1 isoform X2 [Chelonus insularis]|nr:transcription factor CP2-like protein 1 isoform X2 [Chelonus insularis]
MTEKMDNKSKVEDEDYEKDGDFVTPINNLSLNCSGHELFENALSSSFIKAEELMEEYGSYHQYPRTDDDLKNDLHSSSTNSLNSLDNGNAVLPFEHIWIAQLCTWLHARGLQHYGATFPNLFTNKVFTFSKRKFIEGCGPIDGPHIYDTIQLLHWLHKNCFGHLWHQLAGFSIKDLTYLSKNDLASICGREDAIRLIHALKIKLTIYCALDFNECESHLWKIICLRMMTVDELLKEISRKFHIPYNHIKRIKIVESLGIHILLDDDLLSSIKDGTEYLIQITSPAKTGFQELLLRPFCG